MLWKELNYCYRSEGESKGIAIFPLLCFAIYYRAFFISPASKTPIGNQNKYQLSLGLLILNIPCET